MYNDGLFFIPECIIYVRRGKVGTDKYTTVIKEERKNGCAGQRSIFKSLQCWKTLEGKQDDRVTLNNWWHLLKATSTWLTPCATKKKKKRI